MSFQLLDSISLIAQLANKNDANPSTGRNNIETNAQLKNLLNKKELTWKFAHTMEKQIEKWSADNLITTNQILDIREYVFLIGNQHGKNLLYGAKQPNDFEILADVANTFKPGKILSMGEINRLLFEINTQFFSKKMTMQEISSQTNTNISKLKNANGLFTIPKFLSELLSQDDFEDSRFVYLLRDGFGYFLAHKYFENVCKANSTTSHLAYISTDYPSDLKNKLHASIGRLNHTPIGELKKPSILENFVKDCFKEPESKLNLLRLTTNLLETGVIETENGEPIPQHLIFVDTGYRGSCTMMAEGASRVLNSQFNERIKTDTYLQNSYETYLRHPDENDSIHAIESLFGNKCPYRFQGKLNDRQLPVLEIYGEQPENKATDFFFTLFYARNICQGYLEAIN